MGSRWFHGPRSSRSVSPNLVELGCEGMVVGRIAPHPLPTTHYPKQKLGETVYHFVNFVDFAGNKRMPVHYHPLCAWLLVASALHPIPISSSLSKGGHARIFLTIRIEVHHWAVDYLY